MVKNIKINSIDRPAGPGRAGILMHLNRLGRAEVLLGRAGYFWPVQSSSRNG